MTSKRAYNLLVLLFPVVYLFHNLEEWLALRSKATIIFDVLPANIGSFIHDPYTLVSVFGIAVVFATLLPVVVSAIIWGRFTPFYANVLMIIAFATLINAISHIFSALALGFISPGLITAIALCIPYAIGVTLFVKKHFLITVKQYLFLGITSLIVYFLVIIVSWLFAMMFITLFTP
jgi:hypothetical protein